MKVLVIGGTGHVGEFMVSMLVEAGFKVVVATSGKTPVPQDKNWSKVECLVLGNDEDAYDELIQMKPDVVIDMPARIGEAYNKLKNTAKHFIACGSLWMYGEPSVVPTPERTYDVCVFDCYRDRYLQLQQLIEDSRKDGVAFTAIMPPNICGPGKIPLECLGGRSLEVHKEHKSGSEVILPEGPDVLIGPCDAEDIANCFVKAVINREKADGEIFNVGSRYAITSSELVRTYSKIYNVDIPIRRVPWKEYVEKVSPDIGCWWHFKAHMCPDISKASKLLGYEPKYTPEETLFRAVEWMRQEKLI